jgi:DNA-binding HxlR family transcriptional regulator
MVPRRKSPVLPPPSECPLQLCMQFIGGAWTPGVIWHLSGGPRRFSELKSDLQGVSAKMLSARLVKLAEIGIVIRQEMPTSPPTVEYSLSALGQELKPAIESIVSVGHRLKALMVKNHEVKISQQKKSKSRATRAHRA